MRRSPASVCNRCSKRTSHRFLRMWRRICRLKAWKWKDSGSLFFLTDDHRLDHCRNGGNRGCRFRIFSKGRLFLWPVLILFVFAGSILALAGVAFARENWIALLVGLEIERTTPGQNSRLVSRLGFHG